MKRLLLPLLLVICFYSESIFSEYVPPGTFGKTIVPHFLLTLFILMGIFYFRNRAILFAAIFGLVFDIYYTEIIGVYFCLFPVGVYCAAKLAKVLQANIFSALLIGGICLSIIEILVYGFYYFVLRGDVHPEEFFFIRLYPTLILNLIFLLIVYYPFTRFLLKRKKEELKE